MPDECVILAIWRERYRSVDIASDQLRPADNRNPIKPSILLGAVAADGINVLTIFRKR